MGSWALTPPGDLLPHLGISSAGSPSLGCPLLQLLLDGSGQDGHPAGKRAWMVTWAFPTLLGCSHILGQSPERALPRAHPCPAPRGLTSQLAEKGVSDADALGVTEPCPRPAIHPPSLCPPRYPAPPRQPPRPGSMCSGNTWAVSWLERVPPHRARAGSSARPWEPSRHTAGPGPWGERGEH